MNGTLAGVLARVDKVLCAIHDRTGWPFLMAVADWALGASERLAAAQKAVDRTRKQQVTFACAIEQWITDAREKR